LLTFFNKPKPVLNQPTVKAREILHSTQGLSNAALISAGVLSIKSPLLQQLHFIHQNLTQDVLEATENDVLAQFSKDPASFDNPEVGSEKLWVVVCLAWPQAVSQAKPGQYDSLVVALAWPGVLKSQSQVIGPWLFPVEIKKYI
jgi:hypothetical protein